MNNWQTKKLGECLTIRHGRNQREVEVANGKYPILGTGGEMGRTDSFLYDKPSVLIGRKGTIDKPRYMDTPFWTVDTLFYSAIHDNAIPKYIYYVFKTINWYRYNEASGVPSLSASTVSSIKIDLPEKSEQRRIVAVLEVWDEYLELLDRKIVLKEQLKKGLMQQLLTGKKRLPGFTDEWHDVKLLDLATINKGEQRNKSTLSKQKTDLKSYPVINGGISPSGYTDEFNTESMTITISEGGNSCGFVNLIDEAFWCGGHCYKLTEKQDVDKNFLFSLLKLHETRIMAMRVGSGLPNIQKSTVERMKFHITTDCNEQVAVGKIISTLIEEVEQLKVMNGKIRLQKKYLLKNLISGTIRTPENLHIKGAN